MYFIRIPNYKRDFPPVYLVCGVKSCMVSLFELNVDSVDLFSPTTIQYLLVRNKSDVNIQKSKQIDISNIVPD